jgi:hypothetical protein
MNGSREVKRSKKKIMGGGKCRTFYFYGGGRKHLFLFEGFQAMPVRPSDKDRMKMKTLG